MRAGYSFALEAMDATYSEIEPLYRAHYAEMAAKRSEQGIPIGPYALQTERYFALNRAGQLLHYVARHEGRIVGYSNVYLTLDMHNGEPIAREDTIYVTPAHRNGLGRALVKAVLEDLRARGVRRALVTPAIDGRVADLCRRMGFREVASTMIFAF